ncbi:cache domain-containing sensor histidine kinase [Inhella proteolytica]|uniref:histidine kinase n=1 Tax=Inhella proteolytica TaxID=2795029 RepID=A0A931J0L9_9BURK|nr:ATP-binding protein [Inhella proteolytica]MBH9575473.1 PAS domain S-box protein [Inhella proteolytica]
MTSPQSASARSVGLVVAGVVLSISVVLGLALLWVYERQEHTDRELARNELMSALFADALGRQIDGVALALDGLEDWVRAGAAGGADFQSLPPLLLQTERHLPFLRGLLLVDAQGQVRASAQPRDAGRHVNLARLGPLPAPGVTALLAFQPGRDLFSSASAGMPELGFMPLVRSVPAGDAGPHYLVALVQLASLTAMQHASVRDERTSALVVGLDGRLLAAPRDAGRRLGDSLLQSVPFQRDLPAREQGSWTGPGVREGDQIAAFRLLRNWPLMVWVESDKEAVHAQWADTARWLMGAGGLALLFLAWTTRGAVRSLQDSLRAQRERDAAQARALAREQELDQTLRSLQELVFRTDAAGHVTLANQHLGEWRIEGPKGGRRSPSIWDYFDDSSKQRLQAYFAAPPVAPIKGLGLSRRDAAGQERLFEAHLQALWRDGHFIGMAGSAVDVTERTHMQQRLQAQLEFSRQLMEVSPLPKSVYDQARRYRVVNRAWEQFTGRPAAAVVGQAVCSAAPAEQRELHQQKDQELLRTGQPVRYEMQVQRADGSLRDVVINKLLVPAAGGEEPLIMAVLLDVTEFREAERAIAQARDAAEQTLRARTAFVANITHELRTPLQSILGFSELGSARAGDQGRLGQMFEAIQDAGQRMLRLVCDLLDLAKAERGEVLGPRCAVDLRKLVDAALRELEPLAQRRAVHVRWLAPAQALRVEGDPERLLQVLRNVLANALRLAPPDSCVELDAQCEAGTLRLCVADRGPGIPEAELERIFEPFVQSSRTRTGAGGTGLGLAIAREIMAAHAGSIHARNRAGGGSVFEIRLPLDVDAVCPAP